MRSLAQIRERPGSLCPPLIAPARKEKSFANDTPSLREDRVRPLTRVFINKLIKAFLYSCPELPLGRNFSISARQRSLAGAGDVFMLLTHND
jgi:hypothetical protein